MRIPLGASILLLSVSATAQEPVKVQPPAQKVLSSSSGRFVFGQISDFRRDQFLLDTQTGRLWQMVSSGEGENARLVLQPVRFVGADGEYTLAP